MPYVFVGLLAINLVIFGYFITREDDSSASIEKARSELKTPLTVTNTSNEIPPLIGEK